MKIRTPDCECLLCADAPFQCVRFTADGKAEHYMTDVLVRAVDVRGTHFAIKKVRQLIDHINAEAKTAPEKPL